MEYLKKAGKTPATGEDDTRERVNELLKDIESGGEARARFYAESLDGWTGEIVVGADEIVRASESLPRRMKDDIAFAHEQVRMFAEAQLASMLSTRVRNGGRARFLESIPRVRANLEKNGEKDSARRHR